VVADRLDEELGGPAPDLRGSYATAVRRVEELGEVRVVEGRESQVARDLEPELPAGEQGAEGELDARGDERARTGVDVRIMRVAM
jgi:hypothetical protein